MKTWETFTGDLQDVFLSQQLRRIDQSGQRVAMCVVPIGGRIGWDDDLLAPDGWLRCDGTEYEQKRYPRLYNVIANLYGGTPGTTFLVPTVADTIILAGKTKDS